MCVEGIELALYLCFHASTVSGWCECACLCLCLVTAMIERGEEGRERGGKRSGRERERVLAVGVPLLVVCVHTRTLCVGIYRKAPTTILISNASASWRYMFRELATHCIVHVFGRLRLRAALYIAKLAC